MKTRSAIVLGIASLAALAVILFGRGTIKVQPRPAALAVKETPQPAAAAPARVGEELLYDVRLRGIKLGSASYRQRESVEWNGSIASVTEFETELARFKDKERIYSDPLTRLPLKVVREIVNVLVKENIVEVYDQQKYTVTITKRVNGNAEPIVIAKDRPIHNSILLPHFVRDMPRLEPGLKIPANLPTRSVELTLTGHEEIKVPAGTFRTYHFESRPRQIEIWISADDKRIPVKIQGLGLFSYAMVLREYGAPGAQKERGQP